MRTPSQKQPDSTDLQIISVLRENPRITNKDIAERLDLAESTIAQRIRGMADRAVMMVVAQKHVFTSGYAVMCFLFINTAPKATLRAGVDIAKIEEVISVSYCIGKPNLFTSIRAESVQHIHRITEQIGTISGIETIETSLCFRIHKYVSNIGTPSLTNKGADPSQSSRDDAILAVLSQDGRLSNREVARQLNVSEGAIRQRIKKMLRAGHMQFEVVCSPEALGINTIAIVRISTLANNTATVVSALLEIDEVTFVGQTSGTHNIFLIVTTTDTPALGDLCNNQLLLLEGVVTLEVQLLGTNAKHELHTAYFEAREHIPKRK